MIDDLLERQYDRKAYNCLHFAAEVWERLTGDAALRSVREEDFRAGGMAAVFRRYRRVPGPTAEPSVVLMETLSGEAHIGVCWRRRLLHINEIGPQFLPLDAVAVLYRNMRFWV
ncbi:hypothetical protein [Bordetella genomosp. 12]|uniref:Uncharacterized protein n=1 Tax=Bordetella genomosp. 12 TaxID=463035 RepID=A0A261VLG7_9BORD|nr:hypothetical protein [Bordetella genomosp. 12]OZI74591.1 hypothetical protein CAL22_09035 [Bordetella genomosp. 12]